MTKFFLAAAFAAVFAGVANAQVFDPYQQDPNGIQSAPAYPEAQSDQFPGGQGHYANPQAQSDNFNEPPRAHANPMRQSDQYVPNRPRRNQQFTTDPRMQSDQFRPRTNPQGQSDLYYPQQPQYVPPGTYTNPLGQSDQYYPSGPVIVNPPMVQRPQHYLGVSYRDTQRGAQITSVVPGSAAHRVGIEVGDIIVSIDGLRVGPQNPLPRAISLSDGYVNATMINVRDGRYLERAIDLTR